MAMVILDTISKRQLLLERQLHGCKEGKKYKRCAWQSPREMFPGLLWYCKVLTTARPAAVLIFKIHALEGACADCVILLCRFDIVQIQTGKGTISD